MPAKSFQKGNRERISKFFDSQFNLGLALIEQKNYQEAITELNKAYCDR